MNKLFFSLCICLVMISCHSSETPEEKMKRRLDSAFKVMNETPPSAIETERDKPLAAIIEDSDLDSITQRLKEKGIEEYRKRWVNLQKDSTDFFILEPSGGQNPYVEITQENDVYVLVIGEMQMMWYGAIIDFTINGADEMILKVVTWNNENKRYSTDDNYTPMEYKYSSFSREKGIIKNKDQYYLDIDRVEKDRYRVVREEETEF